LRIHRSAADFVDAEIIPHIRDWDCDETVDLSIVARLGKLASSG
jgi:hypothetical protein